MSRTKTKDKPSYPYLKLAEDIRRRIDTGALREGSKLSSIRELARRERLSTPTVAKAIDHLASEGYLQTSERKGIYVSRPHGDGHRAVGRVALLLSITPSEVPRAAHFDIPLTDMQQALMKDGNEVLLMSCTRSADGRKHYAPVETLDLAGLSGIVTVCVYGYEYLQTLAKMGLPMVAYDVDASSLQVDSVSLDDVGASFELATALLKRGHRRIAFVGGPMSPQFCKNVTAFDPCAVLREDGYRLALAAQGGAEPISVPVTDSRQQDAMRRAVGNALRAHPDCTALLAESAETAAEAVREFGAQDRVEVAGWMSLLSSQDLERPVVAAAIASAQSMASETIDALFYRIAHPAAPVQRRKIRPEIVLKGNNP